jgi:hypothetical protein
MKRLSVIAALCAAALVAAAPSTAAGPGAKLRGLDKISGSARDFVAPINAPVKFGDLEVIVRACTQTPPEEQPPEASAYVEVRQAKAAPGAAAAPAVRALVFQGWMFASSPALNAMEHPSYDIWVISCVS